MKRHVPRRAALVPTALLTGLLIVPAAAEARTTLKLTGGDRQTVTMCGKSQTAAVVDEGARMVAQIRQDGRKPKSSAALRVDRCQDGRWVATDDAARNRIRSSARIATREHSDLRIRSRGRTQFARVGEGSPVRIPLSFRVNNVNNVPLPCPVDGKAYTVRGHITAPAGALEAGGQKSMTLYNTGHTFDERLWTFGGVPGFDFVGELAKRGHTSVTYNRIGYENSDKPDGNRSCYASEADVAHQIINQLKSGNYSPEGRSAAKFDRVAIAGLQQGGIVAETVANTFKNQDAILYLGFAPLPFVTPPILLKFVDNLTDCAANSKHANGDPANPKGYAFRGRSDQDFRSTNFVDADPKVISDFTRERNVDPCGFPLFVQTVLGYNAVANSLTKGPVLVMLGGKDPNFNLQSQALLTQRALFLGAEDITAELVPDTGHQLLLERSAPRTQSFIANWLERRGF